MDAGKPGHQQADDPSGDQASSLRGFEKGFAPMHYADTELEAEVEPSLETEQRLAAEAAAAEQVRRCMGCFAAVLANKHPQNSMRPFLQASLVQRAAFCPGFWMLLVKRMCIGFLMRMRAQAEREREAFLAQRAQQALADAAAAEQTRQAQAAAAVEHATALARLRQVCLPAACTP
jgi:hypothetical protein